MNLPPPEAGLKSIKRDKKAARKFTIIMIITIYSSNYTWYCFRAPGGVTEQVTRNEVRGGGGSNGTSNKE